MARNSDFNVGRRSTYGVRSRAGRQGPRVQAKSGPLSHEIRCAKTKKLIARIWITVPDAEGVERSVPMGPGIPAVVYVDEEGATDETSAGVS